MAEQQAQGGSVGAGDRLPVGRDGARARTLNDVALSGRGFRRVVVLGGAVISDSD